MKYIYICGKSHFWAYHDICCPYFHHVEITINIYNSKMSSEFAQGAYFQPSQDGLKTRSSRKKVYKYTDDDFVAEHPITERHRPYENRSNVNDFSFEDRSDKLKTPRRQIVQSSKKEESLSPITGKDSSKKKDFGLRINQIENLSDKISNLLKMVPKGSAQVSQRSNRIRQTTKESKQSINLPENPRQKPSRLQDFQYSPYNKIEEQNKRNRRIQERKRNYSYIEQLEVQSKIKTKPGNQEQRRYYKLQKRQDIDRQSSPILKYRNQIQEETVKQTQLSKSKQQGKPQISESILKENNQQQKKTPQSKYRNINSSVLQKYREQTKNLQKAKQSKRQKENDVLDKKEKSILNNIQLDFKINQVKNRIIQQSPLKLKTYNDALQRQFRYRDEQIYDTDRVSDQPTLQQMATKLSLLIDLDIIQRKIRQSFDQYKNDKKWESLRTELKARGIYLDQKQLKEILKITIHEKNPFGEKIEAFPLNGTKDLAKLFAQTQRIWTQELEKYVSLDDLARQGFEMSLIDINRKGYISIEDLVCFVNVHGGKFYRSRDLAQLFRRFLAIEGKNLQKNINDGIAYKTFMGKLCK